MKKFLLIALITLGILSGTYYLAANYVLERVTRLILRELPSHLEAGGIDLIDPSYETVGLSSPRSAYWSGVTARLRIQRDDSVVAKGTELFVGSYGIEVTLRDLSFRHVLVEIERLNLVPMHSVPGQAATIAIVGNEDPIHGRVTAPYARIALDINPFHPWETLDLLQHEAHSILSDGVTKLQVDCRGELSYTLRGRPRTATILTDSTPAGYAFQLDKNDIYEVASLFETPITDAEISVIAKHPLRAAKLLEIKEKAEAAANAEAENDKKFPFDAYRHVLWSYLLTNLYDEPFAKEVTDAHEAGAKDNTPADTEMDLHNNSIGREYAKAGISEDSVLERFKSDSRIKVASH